MFENLGTIDGEVELFSKKNCKLLWKLSEIPKFLDKYKGPREFGLQICET